MSTHQQTPCSLPWKISIFPGNMMSVAPVAATVKSLSDVGKIFKSPTQRQAKFPKKKLQCWSPALYENEKRRANKNVTSVTALVYDFDHATDSPQTVISGLRGRKVQFILHTTWSHTPSEPRYRVILFLSRPLTPDEYETAWENGLRFLGHSAGVDRQARNISRHYALPVKKQDEEYMGEVEMAGKPLDSDKIAKSSRKPEKKRAERKEIPSATLSKEARVTLDTGEVLSVEEVFQKGEGKYKCACPFQHDASPGSAFIRVMKSGRVFLQCTSSRHDHSEKQWWVREKKKASIQARSVDARKELLQEVPDKLLDYSETRLAYSAAQGVFYRYAENAWQIGNPMRKEHLMDHLVGLLPSGCDKRHTIALIDHVLSRQFYGLDCQATRDPIVYQNSVPMLNLYAWPDLAPVPGNWPRIEETLELLCDGDPQTREWILNWSAALVQKPERRSMVAVMVLSKQQGIGKSLYGRLLAEIIGRGNSAVVSNRALRDNFNSHYVTSLLVLADEVGIDRKAEDVVAELKAFITDDRIHCSTPYAARTTITNRMSWWLTSNKRRPILLEEGDRRFTVLSPGKATTRYREMLRQCFDTKTSKFAPDFREEVQAFAHDLKQINIDWGLIAYPLDTDMKRDIQQASQGSIEAFVIEITRIGIPTILANYPPAGNFIRLTESIISQAVPCETLYGSYREWCGRQGRVDIQSETMLRLSIRDLPNISITKARLMGRTMDVYTGFSTEKREEAGVVVNFPK